VKLTEEENKIKTCDILSLESIRSTLIRQEETIIFALIERAQFRHNEIVYKRGGFGDLGSPMGSTPVEDDTELSFLEYFLVGTVCICVMWVAFSASVSHVSLKLILYRKFFIVALDGTLHPKNILSFQRDYLRVLWVLFHSWIILRISCRQSVVPMKSISTLSC